MTGIIADGSIMITPARGPNPLNVGPVLEVQSFDGAVFAIQKFEAEARGILSSIRERQKDLVRLRFRQGQIVSDLLDDSAYGDGTTGKLSEATGISQAILYDCRKFYELPRFERSFSQMEAWMTEAEERNRSVNWAYARTLVRKALPHNDPEAARTNLDRQKRLLERRAECLEQDADDLERHVQVLPVPEDEQDEAAGVASKAREVAGDLRSQTERLDIPEPRREDRPDYLDHVRSYRCVGCQANEAEAHHVLTDGMNTKGRDYATVPLCRTCHRECHNTSTRAFERTHEVNLWEIIASLLIAYFT